MIVADGITAVGVEKVDTTNLDALISGSQKALMLPPGLALIGLSQKAVSVIEERGVGYYFNLKSELKKQRQNTTAYTAATTLVIGLKAMLNKLHVEGFEKLYEDTKRLSNATKKALEAVGLRIFPKSPAIAMSAVYDEDASQIRKILKTKYKVNIAGGQDHVKSTLFRINHMGIVEPYEIAWCLNSIEMALEEIGRKEYEGIANRVFIKEYYK